MKTVVLIYLTLVPSPHSSALHAAAPHQSKANNGMHNSKRIAPATLSQRPTQTAQRKRTPYPPPQHTSPSNFPPKTYSR